MLMDSIIFVTSYVIIVNTETCPVSYCNCLSVNTWLCSFKTDNDQIDCSNLNIKDNTISVSLDLLTHSTDRRSVFFVNTEFCKINRLKIKSSIIPQNRLITNLKDIESLIIHDDSLPTHQPPADINDLDNLLLGFNKLSILKIEKINLKNWPTSLLETCNTVEDLDLKDIMLENLESNSFSHCRTLKSLRIWFNNIRKLFISAFSGLQGLQALILPYNQIDQIITNGNGWWNVQNLSRLDLSSNRLNRLNPKSFIGLVNLKQLSLKDNLINFIDKSAFEGLNQLFSLNLEKNPHLVVLDLMVLGSMANSLTDLRIDNKSIQCLEVAWHLGQFHKPIQFKLKQIQDCNKGERPSTSSRAVSFVTPSTAQLVQYTNIPMVVALSVFVTILIFGTVFFLLYYSTTRKKIRKYKSASDNMTVHSVNSRVLSYDTSPSRESPSLKQPNTHLLQKYKSDPMLAR